MFERDAWYVACLPHEIADKPLGRTLCGERMVLYRDGDGRAVALEDFCPHRGAPLSMGRVVDGTLVCGYHGLAMGCDGRAVSMPGQRVRGFPAIRAWPVLERDGFVWVWPGDASRADPAALRHLPWANDPAWAFAGGLYHVECDYRLMIDNLMDLSHEKYVHADSIGQKELDEVPVTTRVDGDTVIVERVMHGIVAPPFWATAMRGHGLDPSQPVDRWQRCVFTPPSSVMIDVGVALAGQGGIDAPDDVKTPAIVVDLSTPETASSMWYFWGMARRFRPEDVALTEAIRDGQAKVFSEDLEMLEGQQRNLDRHPERRLLMLNIDAGGVQARKIIERRLAAAQAAATAAAQPATAAAGAMP